MRLASLARVALFASAILGACSSKDDPAATTPTTSRPPIQPPVWNEDCDPLVPEHCGFPFPSNAALVDDPATKTGKRIQFKAGALPRHKLQPTDPKTWADLDGFSPTGTILTVLPYASAAGLPSQDDIGTSITTESKTILIDAATGELVPHFSEIDMSAKYDDERAFMIRPVVRLKDATRYIVAIRRVVDLDGATIPPSPAFKALRDGTPSNEPSVEARRGLYDEIFATLAKQGVPKGDLQIAWDFSTASRENITGDLVHMRDEALKIVGDEGPTYTITKVEENPNEHILKRITARMTVPLFLEKADPPAKIVRGPDGKPKQNGTAEYDVLIHVPKAAQEKPCPLLQNGHGLLGRKTEGQNGYLAQMAQSGCFVAFSVDLVGFAEEDQDHVSSQIVEDIGNFRTTVERQHQGIVNSLLAMRMMMGRFVNEPEIQLDGHSAIDPTRRFYRGDSQGGIFGATYMALSTDVTRGVLGEPGAPYSLLLSRSVDFAPFFFILQGVYVDGYDLQLALGLVQLVWDHTEPGGYIDAINQNPLPGTPKHDVLLHVAIGDHQVTPLGAHIIARAVKAKNVDPFARPIWGLEPAKAPFSGSAIVEYDYGLPEAPKENVPMDEGEDPHDWVRVEPTAQAQERDFFLEGVVKQHCDGACDPS